MTWGIIIIAIVIGAMWGLLAYDDAHNRQPGRHARRNHDKDQAS